MLGSHREPVPAPHQGTTEKRQAIARCSRRLPAFPTCRAFPNKNRFRRYQPQATRNQPQTACSLLSAVRFQLIFPGATTGSQRHTREPEETREQTTQPVPSTKFHLSCSLTARKNERKGERRKTFSMMCFTELHLHLHLKEEKCLSLLLAIKPHIFFNQS